MEFLWRGRWKENEKSALSWEMEHGIRERMHFLTGIPAGNAVLWSLPKVQPRRASLLAWRTRGEENRLGVVQGQYPSIDASFPVTFPRFPFLPFFLTASDLAAGSNRTFWASRDRRWYVWNIVWSSPHNLCIWLRREIYGENRRDGANNVAW